MSCDLPEEAKELGIKLNLGHQEVGRVIEQVEMLYREVEYSGAEWLPVVGTGKLLCGELGYEDDDEFEDALNGYSFSEFLDLLPFVVKKEEPKVTGGWVFKLKPEPPRDEWRPVRFVYTITDRRDLWATVVKSPHGTFEIPELEFEVSKDGRRKINAVYQHIADAVFELGAHVKGGLMPDAHKSAITDTIIVLNALLDVPKPFTIVLNDPSGMSEFHCLNDEQKAKLKVEYPGAEGDGSAAAA